MVNWFDKVLSKDWNIVAAGGMTGEAYLAEKDEQQLFLKRNSSPFLAVLSAEGIVPKLVWTKRLDNGDVITAQEWQKGRKLSPEEMCQSSVTTVLQKIHHSSELLHMLMRLGKKPVTPKQQLAHVESKGHRLGLPEKYADVALSLQYLHLLLPVTSDNKQVVCHGDIDHHNFLQAENGRLYLIDWDNALIADPTMDYANILKWYIPEDKWGEWLAKYGVKKDAQLVKRIYWYLCLDTLHYITWHYERNETAELQKRLRNLHEINHDINKLLG
ncbi:phosphotransferase family protein [Virgibacillus sp. 179-BFC.A HS]|uniref:Phosphotransferase family protein n=1 Tax=Tigheibacillus jepli TaxID=3035914 RepID=A0ABU5CG60_9BACI|nr:phosphotransferase family protein [Virgibacillus sp. 179-BFC.A HS]MDY0405298.1 phosphotransferase family protein [Virgibacillus sp. 179-BFC.A HS]